MSRKKNRRKKATVDLRVQNRRIVVKINQPFEDGCQRQVHNENMTDNTTHHQEKTERVGEHPAT